MSRSFEPLKDYDYSAKLTLVYSSTEDSVYFLGILELMVINLSMFVKKLQNKFLNSGEDKIFNFSYFRNLYISLGIQILCWT